MSWHQFHPRKRNPLPSNELQWIRHRPVAQLPARRRQQRRWARPARGPSPPALGGCRDVDAPEPVIHAACADHALSSGQPAGQRLRRGAADCHHLPLAPRGPAPRSRRSGTFPGPAAPAPAALLTWGGEGRFCSTLVLSVPQACSLSWQRALARRCQRCRQARLSAAEGYRGARGGRCP